MGMGNKYHRNGFKKSTKGYGYASFTDFLIILATIAFVVWFLFRFG